MQIYNASPRALMIRLDNNQLITIGTGEASIKFIGSATILGQVLTLSNPNEVAILIDSSYELDLLRKTNASMAYLCNSLEEAKSKFSGNKEIKPSTLPTNNIHIAKMEATCRDYEAKNKELIAKVAELEKKLAESPSSLIMTELEDRNKDLANAVNELNDAKSQLEEYEKSVSALNKTINEFEVANKTLSTELEDTKLKLSQLAEYDPKDSEEYKQLLASFQTLSDEKAQFAAELEELKAKGGSEGNSDNSELMELRTELSIANEKLTEFDAIKAENESLKSDAEKIVADYKAMEDKVNTARATLKGIMEQFNITYDQDTNTFKMNS